MKARFEVPSYLLTWNPDLFSWPNLGRTVERVRRGIEKGNQWSCGSSHQIKKGDRLFMLRQGREPRGIFGAGWATTDAYRDAHWNPHAKSPTCMYVGLKFDVLLNPEKETILARHLLDARELASVHWNTQQSGIRIPYKAARALEQMWRSFLDSMEQERGASAGGGFGSAESNALVEAAAVRVVKTEYRRDGWSVKSVEADNVGYDLLCRKGAVEIHVEVKGISGDEQSFNITRGEVGVAQNDPHSILCIVNRALSKNPSVTRYRGKEFLTRFSLEPLQYRASPKR